MGEHRRASVVVPVFNGMPYLRSAVASITSQTHPDVQIVLVDGGSTDGSREWVEQFEHPGLVRDFLPPGSGAGTTWTRASELATGDFVKLLCQDDLIYPTALARQISDLERHPSAGMAVARRDIISASGRILFAGRGCAGLPVGSIPGREALVTAARQGTNVFGEPLAVLFRADALAAALPWDDRQPFLLDARLYATVLRGSDVAVSHRTVGAFRVSASSWSTRLASSQRSQFRDWQRMIERDMAPQPWFRVAQARLANHRTVLQRRAAYRWLSWRGDLDG